MNPIKWIMKSAFTKTVGIVTSVSLIGGSAAALTTEMREDPAEPSMVITAVKNPEQERYFYDFDDEGPGEPGCPPLPDVDTSDDSLPEDGPGLNSTPA